MIPKLVHYCWFGKGPKPEYFRLCLHSWQRQFKGYQFTEWNETNTDLEHPFLAQAYRNRQWAFMADFVRIQKLNEYGGIYLDTDMYFLKPVPDSFLEYDAFIGAENRNSLSAGIIGTVPEGAFIKAIAEVYNNLEFKNELDILIPKVLNRVCQDVQWPVVSQQERDWGLVLEPEVFYPLPLKLKKYHWNKFVTHRTIAVHLWAGSWLASAHQPVMRRLMESVKYEISKWYVPSSFLTYARNH